jgi:cell wall assembly regulator SMI1
MDYIKSWAEEHAPKLHASLAPPAGDEIIASLNDMLAANGGISIPPSLEAVWRKVNGSGGQHLLPVPDDSAVFFSVADAIRSYGEMYIEGVVTDGCNSDRTVLMPDEWGLPQWIPVGWLPSGGEIFIDLKPGPEGVLGQVVQNDSEGGYTVLATSFEAYLESIAEGLRSNVFAFDSSWCAIVDKKIIEE